MTLIYTSRQLFAAALSFSMIVAVSSVLSQEKDAPKEKENREAVRKERLEQMRKLVGALKVEVGPEGSTKAGTLKTDPLLRFDDATRDFYDGSLWLFADGGRPHLLVALERYPEFWAFELTLISPPPLSLTNSQGWTWKPRLPAFPDRTVPDAIPSERSAARKQEMSKVAERFTAKEIYRDEGRRELRLMPRPIWQYQDEKQGVLDGALFALANGTNPEVLLVLEARADKDGKRAWYFGVGRLGAARLEAQLDGKVVWEAEPVGPMRSQGPYSYFAISMSSIPSVEGSTKK
jgi:hypothetical protein